MTSVTAASRGIFLRKAACLGALLAAFAVSGVSARAEEAINTGYFGDVAIKGYDPVAYFTAGQAMKGKPEFSYRWLGATWQFASAEHRALFAANPVRYAPQYGGHCADGVSFGTVTTNIDPNAWRIIEGKLYLNYDPGAADGFEKQATKVIDAQKNWPEVRDKLISERHAYNW